MTNPSTCDTLSASFAYDALNTRVKKTIDGSTIKYVYSGLDIALEIVGNKVKVFYLHGPGVDEPLGKYETSKGGKMTYLHADNLGSVVALTDKNGDTINTYGYDPFGKVSIFDTGIENPFQFTGRENDNTGLYYYRARYYSPVLQRFISQDPIGFSGGDLNLYAYVWNNGVNFVDPWGLRVDYNGFVLKNQKIIDTLNAMDRDLPGSDIIVTGGDRYIDDRGVVVIRSSTNNEVIKKSSMNSQHLNGLAVDFVISNMTPSSEFLHDYFDYIKDDYGKDDYHIHGDLRDHGGSCSMGDNPNK